MQVSMEDPWQHWLQSRSDLGFECLQCVFKSFRRDRFLSGDPSAETHQPAFITREIRQQLAGPVGALDEFLKNP